jgi:hypothetical protein
VPSLVRSPFPLYAGRTNIEAVLIGVASFFLMPQSPAKTKSWWCPQGYFNKKEQKIIVNSGKFAEIPVNIHG